MLAGSPRRISLDDRDAAGTASTAGRVIDFLRSNAMVVEVYSPTRWAVTTRADGHCLAVASRLPVSWDGGGVITVSEGTCALTTRLPVR